MGSMFIDGLSRLTHAHIRLGPTRRETLCWLIFLMLRQGSVCLWRLASHAPSRAQTASVRRRFYRFFQFVQIDAEDAARLIVALLGLNNKPLTLAMDRTNWMFGKAHINILMISVLWNGVGVPLIWTMLPGAGNSCTSTRTGLFDRLYQALPDMKIASFTGDREFIGDKWMTYLAQNNIPFALRLRGNQHVSRENYATWSIERIAKNLPRGDTMTLKGTCYLGGSPPLRIVIMRLKTGELLSVACLSRPKRALALYRQRWTIETLFANLKTKGFGLEATHITNPKKISTLIAILAIATALAVKMGKTQNRARPIPIKTHGRPAVSIFALGLATLQKLFTSQPHHETEQTIQRLLKMPEPPPLLALRA